MDPKSVSVIYKVFYLTLHLVFTIYEILRKLRNKLLELCHEFLPINKSRANFPKLEKIPNHLTLLLGKEEPAYSDLANLILWCLAAQISFVSFYDSKGTLKKNEDKLHQLVCEKKIASDHVIWHNNPDSVYKNGYTGRKIHVKVFSKEDGKTSVVDLTRKFALKQNTSVTVDNFHQGLKKQFEFPDPDLGVCCGDVFSLYGYPPWQIRVTEFFRIKTHHNVRFNTFVKLLSRYNRCEQRYGK